LRGVVSRVQGHLDCAHSPLVRGVFHA
jgi:hypothetical protein